MDIKEKGALIAMSGGVDSTVAAYLMLKAGYRCLGVNMCLRPEKDGCKIGRASCRERV